MAQTVIGIFDTLGDAENAIQKLVSSGFTRDDMDLSVGTAQANMPYSTEHTSFDTSTSASSTYGTNSSLDHRRTNQRDLRENDRRDNDLHGDNNSGFGDRVSQFFKSLFDNDDEARKYATVAREGVVLTVYTYTEEEAYRAADILDNSGAINIDERANEFRERLDSSSDKLDSRSAGSENTGVGLENNLESNLRSSFSPDDSTNKSIPIIEENLHVGKREVERGGLRLHSRIVERPVEQRVRLREEFVSVQRTPVDRPATEADFQTFQEGVIELTETTEEAMVTKEARVVEEVRLNKEVTEREEVIRDTVRNTDVDVEEINSDNKRNKV